MAEFRVPKGWDGAIPRAAVLIHRFAGNNSYLMAGNSGSPDLIAGDSFGDAVPTGPLVDLFASYNRVDVLSIDTESNQATLRLRYHRPSHLLGLAIDPMALVLSGKAYLIWVEMHHPHVPKVADIQAVLRTMTREEWSTALSRARTLVGYGKAVEEAIAAIERSDKV